MSICIAFFCRDKRLYVSEHHDLWQDPKSCPYSGRKLGENSSSDEDLLSIHFLERVLLWTIAASLGSFGLGVGYIMLLKVIPQAMVSKCICNIC